LARFELVELHRGWAWRSSGFDLIFGAEALAFDGDGFGVVEQAIEAVAEQSFHQGTGSTA